MADSDSAKQRFKQFSKKRKEVQKEQPESKSESENQNKPSDELIVDAKNEQVVLGQAIANKDSLSVFANCSDWDDFLVENHKVIAWCLHEIYDEGLQVTEDIFDVLRQKFPGQHRGVGGLKYIKDLSTVFDDEITPATYKKHLNKLKTDSIKQKIANRFMVDLMKAVHSPSSSVNDLAEIGSGLDDYLKESYQIEKRGFKTMAEINAIHDEEIKRRASNAGFTTTGFKWFDEFLTEGYAPQKVSIVAGRPGMGKSAYVANSMSRLGNRGIGSSLHALEMPDISMIDRMNAIDTDIPLKKLIKNRKQLTKDEVEAEALAKKKRESKNIHICDDVRKSLYDVKRELRQLKEKYNIKVAFIDLFMKLTKVRGMNNKSTADQYTEMMNEVQRIAREINIHIVVVVQIGRKAEARDSKRPIISDLKDSGAFEEIADNIFLFYRKAYYVRKKAGDGDLPWDILEIIIGKQRQGEVGTVYAKYIGECTKITKASESEIQSFNKKMENPSGGKGISRKTGAGTTRKRVTTVKRK